jgi:peptidoglycan/LPS O-acetylase OafA/YrhL
MHLSLTMLQLYDFMLAVKENGEPLLSDALRLKEIPSLYGIRAIAAFVVLLWHFGLTWADGSFAVICFFVLSGFLITFLLIQEYERTGAISIRKFYARRSLRILPASYVFLLCWAVLRTVAGKGIHWPQWLAALTYTRNYYQGLYRPDPPQVLHFWSLAVEEQFYLLWPPLFLVALKRRANVTGWLVGFFSVVVALRLALCWLGVNGEYIYTAFETRADALALGCLIAVLACRGSETRFLAFSPLTGVIWFMLVVIVKLVMSHFGRFAIALYMSVLPLAFAGILVCAIRYHKHRLYSWLNTRPMRYLGLLSYSLYLYHPIGNSLAQRHGNGTLLAAGLGVGLAIASYHVVEKPFLRLKGRWTVVEPSSKTTAVVNRF